MKVHRQNIIIITRRRKKRRKMIYNNEHRKSLHITSLKVINYTKTFKGIRKH